jgi:hypothetical protein
MIVYEHVTCEQNGRGLSAALPHGPGRRRLERENNGAQQIGIRAGRGERDADAGILQVDGYGAYTSAPRC